MKKKQIGVVGVDSAQVMIGDPCYVDSEWKKEEFQDVRIFEVNYNGRKTTVDMGLQIKRGFTFESPFAVFGGMTMNQLVGKGFAKHIPNKPSGNFSYDGACGATDNEDQGGQLYYRMGHPGVAVVCRTGYGDGMYPVIAHYDRKTGRVRKVEIIFF